MFEFKLQVGCLIVLLYFIASYIKDTLDKKIPSNPLFDIIFTVTLIAVIFDGATAWTVNHMDIVPDWLNLLLHGGFFVFMNAVTMFIFIYMIDQTVGISGKKNLCLSVMPGIIATIGILVFLNRLYYVQGNTTNYSMGTSVIIGYLSLFVHFLMIFCLICLKHKTIEKRKIFSVIVFMAIALSILISQVLMPEILISSLVPTITVIGIYMNFENPSLRRIQYINDNMVTGFATLVETRDNSTGGHIKRTKGYVQIIMNEMRNHPKYAKVISRDYYENVSKAAPMHDIGKISTPDYILQKPGKLTEEEYSIMKQHTAVGGEIIKETFSGMYDPEYNKIAYEVARYHHEKWNGKGYPDGLSGEDIPLHARIMAVADVFDAVSAKRCYRDALPIDKCFKIIEDGSGSDFDPDIVEMFIDARSDVLKYYENDNLN